MVIKIIGVILCLLYSLYSQQLPSIAVLDMTAKGIDKEEASVLTDKLRGELFQTGRYQVIERSVMDEVLKEQGFQQTGCVSSECAVEAGQLIGVQYMVSGSIGRIEKTYLLSIGLINVATGKIEKSVQKEQTGSLTDVLKDGIPYVAKELTKRLSDIDAQPVDAAPEEHQAPDKKPEKSSVNKGNIVVSLSYSLGILSSRYENNASVPVLQDDVDLNVHGVTLGAGYRFGYHFVGASFTYHVPQSSTLPENGHTIERTLWGITADWFFERLHIRDLLIIAPGVAVGYWHCKDLGKYADEPEKTVDLTYNIFGGPKVKLEAGWKQVRFYTAYTLLIVMDKGEYDPVPWKKAGEPTYYEGVYSLSNIINVLNLGIAFQFNIKK